MMSSCIDNIARITEGSKDVRPGAISVTEIGGLHFCCASSSSDKSGNPLHHAVVTMIDSSVTKHDARHVVMRIFCKMSTTDTSGRQIICVWMANAKLDCKTKGLVMK